MLGAARCPPSGVDEWEITYWKTFQGTLQQVPGTDFCWDPGLPIYTDGSCLHPTHPRMAAAGAAAVQQDAAGRDHLAVRLRVPRSFPQTAASGEHLAVALVGVTLPAPIGLGGQVECVTDCASVVRSAQHRRWAVGEARPFGGVWKDVPVGITVRKTRAHRTALQAQAANQRVEWSGNAFADEQARLAASVRAPEAGEAAAFAHQVDLRARVLVAAARQLALWPPPAEALRSGLWVAAPPTLGPRRRRERREPPPHAWGWVAGLRKWACHTCGLLTRDGRRVRLPGCVAGLAGVDLGRILADTRSSHTPLVFETGPGEVPLVFCNLCGAFSQTCLRQLQLPCFGPSLTSRAAEQRLRSLRRGQPPIADDVFAVAIRPAWVYCPPQLLPPDVAALVAVGRRAR